MTETTDHTIAPADFGDAFDAWIGGATLAQKSVDIYGDPGLYAQYEALNRELELAQGSATVEEAAQGDSRVADIEQQMVHLYERWMASKSTWTIRALPTADREELSEKHPDLPELAALPAGADKAARAQHKTELKARAEAADARNYEILERVIMKIEFADGRVLEPVMAEDEIAMITPAITGAQLAKLRRRLGDAQYVKLINTSKLAAVEEPVIVAPFSRSNSKADQT